MTYSAIPVFMIEFTGQAKVGLRRYRSSRTEPPDECPREGGKWLYHGAVSYLGTAPLSIVEDDHRHYASADYIYPDHADPRWPATCECGYRFAETDEWQNWSEPLYRRVDNGEETTIRDAAPGAMWDAWWYPLKGPDGLSLVVKCPNGREWMIDGRASNCTMPDDNEHRCWVRTGTPPEIVVNKAGLTCAAGAGSIQAGDYHGFLGTERPGWFTAG